MPKDKQSAAMTFFHGAGPARERRQMTLSRAKEKRVKVSLAANRRGQEAFDLVMDFFGGDKGKASAFLNWPHPMLGDKEPMDLAMLSDEGLASVQQLIKRAKYGIAA